MPLFFTVIRGLPRVGGPDDLMVPTIGNHSQFPPGIVLLSDGELVLTTRLTNTSVLGALRVTTGEDLDLILEERLESGRILRVTENGDVRITEDGYIRITEGDWPLPPIQFIEAPSDVTLYTPSLPSVSSANSSGDLELLLAPADVNLWMPSLASTSALSALEVTMEPALSSEEDDPVVGDAVSGDAVV